MIMKKPLTPKQERFVPEYLVDLNGTAAAIRAGYSERSAKKIAHELLQKPEVKQALAKVRRPPALRARAFTAGAGRPRL